MDDGFTVAVLPGAPATFVAEIFSTWLVERGGTIELDPEPSPYPPRYSDASVVEVDGDVFVFGGGVRDLKDFAVRASLVFGKAMYATSFDEGWEEFGLWRHGEVVRHIGDSAGLVINEGRPLGLERGTIEKMSTDDKELWLECGPPDASLSDAPDYKTSLSAMDFLHELGLDLYEAGDQEPLVYYLL